jgi:PKD repeat protein
MSCLYIRNRNTKSSIQYVILSLRLLKSLCFTLHFLIFFSTSLSAQKEDYNWLMGSFPRPHFIYPNGDTVFGPARINFNFDPAKVYYENGTKFDMGSTNTSISDRHSGQLMAYSGGQAIADGQHLIIEDTINYDYDIKSACRDWEYNAYTNPVTNQLELGGLKGLQDIVMLPHGDSIVMVQSTFQYCTVWDNYRLIYHTLRHDSITDKTTLIRKDKVVLQEAIDDNLLACRHANGRDWWLVVRSDIKAKMLVFLLDDKGITYMHSNPTGDNKYTRSKISTSIFSLDGNSFAYYQSLNYTAKLAIAKFDRCSGQFSNFKMDSLPRNGFIACGVAFSPDNRYFYAGNGFEIFQYDMTSQDVINSRQIVATYDGFVSILPGSGSEYQVRPNFLIPGPDGKIYTMSSGTSNKYLSTIEFPDEKGINCDVRQHSVKLPTNVFRTIPNFPNYRLGPLDGSVCDTLGIDNHPIAKYRYEPDTINYRRIRFTDLSYFRPETWSWDYGDGSPLVSQKHNYHTFPADGTYRVCLTVSNENSSNTACRDITIGVSSTDDEENIHPIDVHLFPNPVEDVLLVTIGEYVPADAYIEFYSTLGQQVHRQKAYFGHNNIDLSSLPSGVYTWRIVDRGDEIKSGKITKM